MGLRTCAVRLADHDPINPIADFDNTAGDFTCLEIRPLEAAQRIALLAREVFDFDHGKFVSMFRYFRLSSFAVGVPTGFIGACGTL